jgi:peroxiredoxin/Tfp pilus assembly protein PilF
MRRTQPSRETLCRVFFACFVFVSVLPAQVEEGHQAEYRQELAQADRALQDRDYEVAREHYALANDLARGRSVDALRGLAWAELRLEHPEKSLENAQTALPLAANNAERGEIHNLMGAILFSEYAADKTQTSKLVASIAEFRAAIQLNAEHAGAYFNLGTALLKDHEDEEGVKMLRKYLELAPDAANAAQVSRLISDPRLSRGELAPGFTLQDTKGQTISIDSLHGRVVLLDFWATWCGPCIASLPEIRKLARQFPGDQFVLIGVNEDEDAEAWRKFLVKEDMPWPQSRDQNWDLFHSFGLAPERKIVVPAYVVIDRDGIVLQKIRGLEDASSLAALVEAALGTSSKERSLP